MGELTEKGARSKRERDVRIIQRSEKSTYLRWKRQ
jgi:hypothetical protein